MAKSAQQAADLSVGDLSAATGLSPDTIRVWERRYGRPVPQRLASGHRRYTREQLRWLRRVAEALACGHRPGVVVRADEEALTRLLEGGQPGARDPAVGGMLEAVRRYDAGDLLRRLEAEWAAREPVDFLETRAGALLTAVGRAWADGDLEVRHEHFVAELLEDFLRRKRAAFKPEAGKPLMVLTTLPGEAHGLGVQLAAVVCAVQGWRLTVLGPETPVRDIAGAACDMQAGGVAISVSLSSSGVATDRLLAELRNVLPAETALLVGGAGARGPRRGVRGVTYVRSLHELAEWLRATA